ncbi:MAG TPA: hypothetical protein PLB67_15120 [Candidatus Hydrogenedentes bacterium]|nr:hypothetical protein [FCB group bacterium]HNZ19635.1 hypothetical protein [Candidatus Hydrogenedentota bacterium]HOH33107.1 hypothetical protein [Candidatus Hydrogenedentota bacterium]HPA05767.1 hypothetical protein [Candidatus Hydrogenedentota bacterium]HQE75665.1 hypothetical protein [Candidatus Hydrogenedentota bacterium]
MPTDADSVRPGRLRRIITSPFRHWRWAVAGLVGLAAVYAAVDQVLMKRLAVQLDRLRAAGRPATFAELGVGNLPPAENAAPLYRAAGKNTEAVLSGAREADLRERLVNATTCPRHAQDDDHDYSLLTEAEKQAIAGEMRAMAPELARVLDARTMPGCEFGNYASLSGAAASPAAVLPDLAVVRSLARNLAYKAVWEAEQGNTEEALTWVAANLRLANDLTGDPLLVTGLVRVAVASIAVDSLERILHERDLPENVPAELYAELDALRDRKKLAHFLDGERCFAAAYTANPQTAGNFFTRVFYYAPGAAGLNEVTSMLAEAVEEEDCAKRRELLTPLEKYGANAVPQQGASGPNPLLQKKNVAGPFSGGFTAPWNMMVEITAPALVRAAEAFERQAAQAEMARVALAIKAFRRDTGTYPETLDDLAPRYLPELPRDPYSGQDFIYTRDESGFLLYSVGPNGTDDGGLTLTGPGGARGDILWCGGLKPEP